jgi:GcrA cell cycle regulator
VSWTDERINTLKKMWQSGKSASEIAEKLGGVTRNAVIGKAHRLGLSGRPSPIKVQPKKAKAAAPAPKKALPPKAAMPPKKQVIAPAKPVAAAPKIAPKTHHSSGKSLPPTEAAPLAALANATSRPDGKIISILEVSERLCRWPVGDPREPGFGYCGSDAANGHVYCAEHVAIAFQAPNRKDKKPVVKTAAKAEVPELEDLVVEVEVEDDEEEDVVEEDDDDTPISPVVAV